MPTHCRVLSSGHETYVRSIGTDLITFIKDGGKYSTIVEPHHLRELIDVDADSLLDPPTRQPG